MIDSVSKWLRNGSVYEALGILEHFTFKPLIYLLYVLMLILTISRPMTYTHCYVHVLYSSNLSWLSVHWRKTYSFAIFGCSVGWCELQMCIASGSAFKSPYKIHNLYQLIVLCLNNY